MQYRVDYYDKDGNGWCGSNEPWILDEYSTIEEAEEEKGRLEGLGFKNVSIKEIF